MILRNQVEWALHCCALLAGLQGDGTLSTKDLAEFHGVPKEYLSKALQALSQAGLVTGTLGPRGGYRLAKPPAEITFLDVVEAVEGPRSTFQCTEIRKNSPCRPPRSAFARPCQVARVMYAADEAWRETLRRTTLADLGATLARELPADLVARNDAWVRERA
jgi:Rrf2 family protein